MVDFLLKGSAAFLVPRRNLQGKRTLGELNQGRSGDERKKSAVDQPVSTESSLPPEWSELSIVIAVPSTLARAPAESAPSARLRWPGASTSSLAPRAQKIRPICRRRPPPGDTE